MEPKKRMIEETKPMTPLLEMDLAMFLEQNKAHLVETDVEYLEPNISGLGPNLPILQPVTSALNLNSPASRPNSATQLSDDPRSKCPPAMLHISTILDEMSQDNKKLTQELANTINERDANPQQSATMRSLLTDKANEIENLKQRCAQYQDDIASFNFQRRNFEQTAEDQQNEINDQKVRLTQRQKRVDNLEYDMSELQRSHRTMNGLAIAALHQNRQCEDIIAEYKTENGDLKTKCDIEFGKRRELEDKVVVLEGDNLTAATMLFGMAKRLAGGKIVKMMEFVEQEEEVPSNNGDSGN